MRVARALEGLPLISASFSRGEISYSKVRAMTRVATPENEDTLLNVALYGTATHVERLVRKYRRFERLEASAEAQERYRQRYVRYGYDEDGSLLIQAKLPPEIGALVKKALEAAVEVLYQDSRRLARETAAKEEEKEKGKGEGEKSSEATVADPGEAEGTPIAGARIARTEAGAAVEVEIPSDVSAGTDGKEISALAPLPCSAPATIPAPDLASTPAPVPTPGPNPSPSSSSSSSSREIKTQSNVSAESSNASAVPNNAARISLPPPMQTAAPVPATQAPTSQAAARTHETPRPLFGALSKRVEAPLGTAAIEEFHGQDWCESLGARRADALKLLAERYLTEVGARSGPSADRYQVVVHIDQALLAGSPALIERASEDERPRRLWDRCEFEDGAELAVETARRLACDGALVGLTENADGEPLNVGRKTRSISPALSRALKSRDGGCRFPGCGRTYFTQGHHVKHWADGGETKLSNVVTLCRFHHGLVHEGGFSVEATGDGGFIFRQPDGKRIEEGGRPAGLGKDYGVGVVRGEQYSAAPGEQHVPNHVRAFDGQRAPDAPASSESAASRRPSASRRRNERPELPLFALNRARGLDIDADTSRLRWLGEHMDYGYTVAYMVQCRDLAREREGRELAAGRM